MKPILKYPGAKWNLANWIISYFPKHKVYLEPFFGSGAVFFNKQPSTIETINDLDGNVVNLFKVIREQPNELSAVIDLTPWSRQEYKNCYDFSADNLENARRFLVRCWQAFGTKTGAVTGFRHTIAGNAPNYPQQWKKIPKRILQVADRLKDAQIENKSAIDLISAYNDKEVLIYADPPYVPGTRTKQLYACEMNVKAHEELIEILKQHKGPVILSGHDNDLYNNQLDWQKKTITAVAEHGNVRREVLWINDFALQELKSRLF